MFQKKLLLSMGIIVTSNMHGSHMRQRANLGTNNTESNALSFNGHAVILPRLLQINPYAELVPLAASKDEVALMDYCCPAACCLSIYACTGSASVAAIAITSIAVGASCVFPEGMK